jgi:hypothetical protein
MGIDNVAIKTFNSTGAQSVCRANESDETKLIESQFLTKCTTEYINGSGMSFINGQQDILVTGLDNETFYIPSTSDAISEITFQMSLKKNQYEVTGVSKTIILDLIRKIEVKLGNLTVQEILPGDIYARNLTELGTVVNTSWFGGNADSTDAIVVTEARSGFYKHGGGIDFSLSIPFIGRTKDIKRSFLQAGAITNNLSIKVLYNKGNTSSSALTIATVNPRVNTGICIFTHIMSNVEKNFISKNIINRIVNTSQSIQSDVTVGASLEGTKKVIDLSNINLNVSHILLTLNKSPFLNGTLSATNIETLYSGVSDSTWGSLEPSTVANAFPHTAEFSAKNIGVVNGWLNSAELILGSDRTGKIPASCLSTRKIELFKLISVSDKNIYILKLADSSFSTAGVPFSRLSNKSLELYFNPIKINALSGASAPQITVTCCGTRVQSTVGGTISFSA